MTSAGQDGHNVITFVDTPDNRNAIEMAGDPLGLTLSFFVNGELIESDVIFNPTVLFSTTVDTDTELFEKGLQDIETVATHEFGHVVGLHHTGVESATMWPLASVLGRTLDADDVAGARALYPSAQPGGTISGTVTVAGQPAFGAQVVAVNAQGGIAASALTLPDGTYAVEALPADIYTVYAEPLDGPHASIPDGTGCVRVGNLAGAGIYSGQELTTNFPTTFSGGNDLPNTFPVASGSVVPVDFALPSGVTAVNPTLIGPATVDGGSISAQWFTSALGVAAGTEQWLIVGGPNFDQVGAAGITFSDAGIEVDSSSLHQLSGMCGGLQLPFIVFRATIAPTALAGGRSLFLRVGSALSALTGGVRVQAATPTCGGDCDGNRVVTVDELLTMVTRALGTATTEPCPAGDASGDGQITVDEILTAVGNALSSCP